MKYPAIYKSVEGSEYLYQNKDSYYCYERQLWDSSEPHHDYHHSDTNITAEYLANTYGEVKSKEHAHFIVELGEGAGYELVGSVSPHNAGVFVFDGENKTLFFMLGGGSLRGGSVLKQITIPLPPECEERKPKEVIANGKKHTLNLVTGFYDFSVIELGYVSGSTLKKLQEADDYQVLSFVDECDGSKEDEWPKVGECAILKNENDYEITHGTEAIGEKVKVMSLFKDGDLDMAVIKHDITNYCFRVDMLSKPKTPEEELNYELYRLCLNHCDSKLQASEIARKLMSKYNITKKPQ